MSLRDLDEPQFRKVLYSRLSPSRPITSIELLKGLCKKLQQIREAFASPGRHVFIYGDRGVGKTSLAQTAASLHNSADASPISLSCGASFFQIIQDLLRNCSAPRARSTDRPGGYACNRCGIPSQPRSCSSTPDYFHQRGSVRAPKRSSGLRR